jgi:ATP-binding protein involved in chromosome partitioning
VSDPESAHARTFRAIAERVWDQVSGGTGARQAPRIVLQ